MFSSGMYQYHLDMVVLEIFSGCVWGLDNHGEFSCSVDFLAVCSCMYCAKLAENTYTCI